MTGNETTNAATRTYYQPMFDLYEQTRALLEDFKWMLDQHPENKGAYSDGRIYETEEALRHIAPHI